MPSRSRSASVVRGRKRYRSRSASGASGMYASALASRSRSRTAVARRTPVRSSLNVHRFSRYSTAATLDVTSTTLTDERQFKFDDILGNSEFTALFDSYRIDKVVMMIQLITNPNATVVTNSVQPAVANQSSNWYPRWWYIRDYDGGGADSLASIKERQGVKCFTLVPNKIFRIAIKPKVLVQTYSSATTTGYLQTRGKSMFIDMANTAVPHYGLNSVVDCLGLDPNDTYPFKIRFEFKFYFTCKDVR